MMPGSFPLTCVSSETAMTTPAAFAFSRRREKNSRFMSRKRSGSGSSWCPHGMMLWIAMHGAPTAAVPSSAMDIFSNRYALSFSVKSRGGQRLGPWVWETDIPQSRTIRLASGGTVSLPSGDLPPRVVARIRSTRSAAPGGKDGGRAAANPPNADCPGRADAGTGIVQSGPRSRPEMNSRRRTTMRSANTRHRLPWRQSFRSKTSIVLVAPSRQFSLSWVEFS